MKKTNITNIPLKECSVCHIPKPEHMFPKRNVSGACIDCINKHIRERILPKLFGDD